MLTPIRNFFGAAPHIPRRSDEEIRRVYPWFRIRIMEATFLGYAAFYLVRNNFSPVAKDLKSVLHYTPDMLGTITAVTAISYGVGKFLMGSVSDRCNPRPFMATGLLLTALCNFAFGSVADYHWHLVLWTLNGFFQGMGWPPCGRSMGHWFAERERGLTFSIWNTSHNLGGAMGGMAAAYAAKHFGGWQYAFYFPGILAVIGAVYLFWRLRDTPQSVGLPPIEEYKGCAAAVAGSVESAERELSLRELLFNYALNNPWIWLLAIGNFFAYIARYSMLDWGPLYVREVKGADLMQGGMAVFWSEMGGIPSTILLGWVSDLAGGRRGMVAVLCLIPIMLAFTAILLTPPGHLWVDYTMMAMVGFFVYPVINFVVIIALDLTSKKAIGTAAGFIGLFGYLGRTAQAKGFGWMLSHFEPLYGRKAAWDMVLYSILGCTAAAVVFLAFTWRLKPRGREVVKAFPVIEVEATAGPREP